MKSPQVSYTGAETPNVQPDGLSQRSPSRMLKSNEYLSEGEMEDRAKDMADMDTSAAIKESHLDSGKPRPEVTLRTKRFIALVLLSVGFIGFITAIFLWGINVDSVNEAVGSSTKSENTVDKYNTYSGIVMGVFETILGLGFGNFFPVFTTYVYNLKWFPGDDPSVRVSKVKKVGVMLFFPLLMVAFGNTFTALQAGSSTNGADLLLTPSDLNATAANSNSATNTTNELIDFADSVEELHSPLVQLEDTILRTVVDRRVTPFEYSSNSVCTNKITASGISYLKRLSAIDSTSLIAGFPINEWAKEMYPETPLVVSDDKLDLDTSFKLAFHGQAMMEYTYSAVKSRKPCTTDDTDTSDGYANADCYDSTATNTVLPNMLGYVNGTYEQSYDALDTAIADGIEFVFSSSDGSIQAMNRSTLSVEHQSFSLSSSMKLDALSISMEFNIDQYGNYEGVSWEDCSGDYCEYGYDFYSNGGFCGSTSCVFFDYENTYRAIPRLQALMTRYMKSCSDTIEYSPDVGNDVPIDCSFESNSAFIYGHGARMIGESVVNTNSSGEVYPYAVNLRHQVYFTFGRITWESQDLSATFGAQCESVTGCHGYYHNLSSSGRYVMLAEFNLPEAVSSADFIHPIKLYELVSPVIQQQANQTAIPFRLEKDNFNEYSISLKGDNCSSIAESFINQIEVNHYWENDPMQATYTSALLYLFQRGAVTSVFQEDIGTSFGKMALSQDLMLSTIYVSNTTVGAVTLWVGCGIILLLAIAALVMPNERARLGPPRGSNIRAERFIGVQTEELYPNLVYKKRFLVGEEIKFREFAVESVTLHHKMEEEAQVRL